MTTAPSKEAPLANLDKVVQDCLAYFDGPGRASTAHRSVRTAVSSTKVESG